MFQWQYFSLSHNRTNVRKKFFLEEELATVYRFPEDNLKSSDYAGINK